MSYYCSTLKAQGYSDWRLPTLDEVRFLEGDWRAFGKFKGRRSRVIYCTGTDGAGLRFGLASGTTSRGFISGHGDMCTGNGRP